MQTNDRRAAWLVVLGLCLVPAAGCSSGECACLDCQTRSVTLVAWTDQTALGSPEALFSPFPGTCQAPFRWDASGWSTMVTVEPVQGESTLTATVVLQQSSARWLIRTQCPNALQVDGTVTLELPEGTVAEQRPVTISAEAGMIPTSLEFALKEEEFGPWVSISKSDPASTLSMSIQVTALAQACSGQIRLTSQTVSNGGGGANAASGADGPFATWSTGVSP
jgi:hypothetical protein